MQGCHLPAVKPLKPVKPLRRPFPGYKSRRYMLHFLFTGSESNVRRPVRSAGPGFRACEAVLDGVQGCRLPAVKPLKPMKPVSADLSQATSFGRRARLPLACRQTRQTRETPPQTFSRPQVSQVHATLSLYRFRKQRSARPVRSAGPGFRACEAVFDGMQGCRLPAVKPLKPVKPLRRPFPGHKSRRYMLHFLFTGSESNVRHGWSVEQGPVFFSRATTGTLLAIAVSGVGGRRALALR